MKIYFVRHGQTTFNLHHVLMGRTGDEELNEHGIEQADEVAEVIADSEHKFDVIFASPLHRARKTAMIIAKRIHAPLHFNEELEERDYGNLEGKTYADIEKETGYSFPYIEEHLNIDVSKYHVESPEDLKKRLLHFLEEVKAEYSEKTVLVVTHKGIIHAMYQFFPQHTFHNIDNASVHEFEI